MTTVMHIDYCDPSDGRKTNTQIVATWPNPDTYRHNAQAREIHRLAYRMRRIQARGDRLKGDDINMAWLNAFNDYGEELDKLAVIFPEAMDDE